jgi:hypothetical protein
VLGLLFAGLGIDLLFFPGGNIKKWCDENKRTKKILIPRNSVLIILWSAISGLNGNSGRADSTVASRAPTAAISVKTSVRPAKG